MMETTGNGGNSDVRARTVVLQLDSEEELSTREEQTVKADSVLKSLSPLIISMRMFGLYFTPKLHLDPSAKNDRCIRRCQTWNAGRIYATVMLVMHGLTSTLYCLYLDSEDNLGASLFLKLGIVTSALLNVILRSTYYVASHTGSLDRVFCDADLSVPSVAVTYSCRAKVVTIVSWTLVSLNFFYYINSVCITGQYSNISVLFFTKTYLVLKNSTIINIIKAFYMVLHLENLAAWSFPQAMNFLVMTFLYDQFNVLSEEFSKCIGDQGEFSGNFEQFRRRHQAISHSVQEADRFLMISNVACFCCQIVSIILVLYSAIFFQDETVALSTESAVFYIIWLAFNVIGLALIAGLAIIVNHTVSLRNILRYGWLYYIHMHRV